VGSRSGLVGAPRKRGEVCSRSGLVGAPRKRGEVCWCVRDPNATPRFFNHNILYETVKQGWLAGYEQLLRAGANQEQLDEDGLGVSRYIEKLFSERLGTLIR